MKSISVLYPSAELGNPTTGGQVYDYRLFGFIMKHGNDIQFIDDNKLGRDEGESVLKLPFRLLSKIKNLSKKQILIFNTALFPYYILPFFILKLFYPHLIILGIHHHFRFQEQTGWKRKIYKTLEFLNLKQCSVVINPCPYTRDILLKNWINGRVVTLENSFDVSDNKVSLYNPYRLLYVGSIYERKGIIYLLKALSILPKERLMNVTLDLVGSFDENSKYVKTLKEYIKENNLGNIVKFHGRVTDKELKRFYSNAYAFVLPSLLEGYGLVIVEAMSYGLPVIAFNNSAMPYTIQHEYNGLLAKDKDVKSLSNNILRLLEDGELHNKLAKNAKHYSEKAYSIEQLENDSIKFLESL